MKFIFRTFWQLWRCFTPVRIKSRSSSGSTLVAILIELLILSQSTASHFFARTLSFHLPTSSLSTLVPGYNPAPPRLPTPTVVEQRHWEGIETQGNSSNIKQLYFSWKTKFLAFCTLRFNGQEQLWLVLPRCTGFRKLELADGREQFTWKILTSISLFWFQKHNLHAQVKLLI